MKKFNSLKDLSSILSEDEKLEIDKLYNPTETKDKKPIRQNKHVNNNNNKCVEKQPKEPIKTYKKQHINTSLLKNVLERNKLLNNNTLFDKESICDYLDAIGCDNYKIHNDLTVDIIGDIRLIGLKKRIPIKFNKVFGNFSINGHNIESMINFPKMIGGDFVCTNTLIKDFDHFPEFVDGDICLRGNKNIVSVTSGLPRLINNIDISHCNLKMFKPHNTEIIGNIDISSNQLRTISIDCVSETSKIDLSNNFITTKLKTDMDIDYSGNPCQPNDEFDSARW